MAWPLASHFSAMLQNPRVAFRDPKLHNCVIERDAVSRQPRPWAGAFAVVYKAVGPNGQDPFALRIFTCESPERRERYELIAEYLTNRKLNSLVNFEYYDRSIRSASDGRWYPLIVMEWVSGQTIFQWTQTQCSQGNAKALKDVAERWLKVVNELRKAQVAHGDFQQGNIMVSDAGELKLVDYDCMCVPSLVGRRNLEVGVAPYQHPGRNEHTPLSLDLDNFSALLIYVALRALAVNPHLWQKYVVQSAYDKMLFRTEDFQSPDTSALHADLMASPDEEVRDLTAKLFAFAQAPISQTTSVGQFAGSLANVEQLLKAKKWEDAVHVLNRRGYFNDAAAELQPLIRHAYEYVCRKDAWEEYCRVPQKTSEDNDRRLVDAWNETLFSGFEAAERQRVRVAEARKRVNLLDRLNYLIQQSSGKITLGGEQAIVQAVSKLPQGYKYTLLARVGKARSRVSTVARIEKAVKEASSEAMIVAAWRAVVEVGCENVLSPPWRARVELAEKRAPVLKKLHDIPRDLPEEERSKRLIATWNADLLKDCREADRWRETYDAAIAAVKAAKAEAAAREKAAKELDAAREQLMKDLQQSINDKNEAEMLKLADDPRLAEYPLPNEWKKAVDAARENVSGSDALFQCVQGQQEADFHRLFDARLIRAEAERYEPFREALGEWTSGLILPPGQLGIDPEQANPSIAPARGPAGTYRVQWNWPDPRFTEQLVLAVCENKPGPEDPPQQVTPRMRLLLDRPTWDKDGGCRLIRTKIEWVESYVAVWAVIDLGFRAFVSNPLIVGQLGAKSSWKWKGWKLLGGKDVGEESEQPGEVPENEHIQQQPPPDAQGQEKE